MKQKTFFTTVFLFFLFIGNLFAQHHGHTGPSHVHANHAAVFIGGTSNLDHKINYVTIGIDYERRITKTMGLGVSAEFLNSAEGNEVVFGIPFIYHIHDFKVTLAPMGAYIFATKNAHGTTDAALEYGGRVGIAYDFHFGKLSVSPTVNYDYIKTSALVFGLGFGVGF